MSTWRRNRTRQPSDLHWQLFVQSLEMAIHVDRPKFMPMVWKRLTGSSPGRGSTRPPYHRPSLAKWRHRSMVRRKLGARSAARRGDQWSRANSPTMSAYSAPTARRSPSTGANPSRMALLRDRRARATTLDFGSGSSSGAKGTLSFATRRKRAIPSRSARSHASTVRTAIRKHMPRGGIAEDIAEAELVRIPPGRDHKAQTRVHAEQPR